LTYTIDTLAPARTASSVQETLLESITSRPKLWACTAKHAVAVVASIRIVALSVATHNSLALHISACALPTSTCKPIAAAGAVWLCLVFGAVWRAARAHFLGIAIANRVAAHGIGRGKLAVAAAIFVGVIADGVVDEFAGCGVAACVVFAACGATAVTLLVALDNAVAAGLTGEKGDVSVVGETLRLDAISSECRADVANGAWRKAGNAG